MRWWVSSNSCRLKPLPQSEHSKERFSVVPLCVRWCSFQSSLLLNFCQQILHSKGRFRGWAASAMLVECCPSPARSNGT